MVDNVAYNSSALRNVAAGCLQYSSGYKTRTRCTTVNEFGLYSAKETATTLCILFSCLKLELTLFRVRIQNSVSRWQSVRLISISARPKFNTSTRLHFRACETWIVSRSSSCSRLVYMHPSTRHTRAIACKSNNRNTPAT